MPYATAGDGASIRYEVEGSGIPLLLVSGLGGLASFWNEQLPLLRALFRVVTYDHRGAGLSARSNIEYSIDQMAQDAVAVLESADIDSAVIIGHSTGGCIGASLALDYPNRVRGLISSSSWAAPDPYFQKLFEFRKYLLTQSGAAAYVRSGIFFQYPPAWISSNPGTVAKLEESALHNVSEPGIVASKIDALLRFNRLEEFGSIESPVFVTAATDDLICPAYLSEKLASATKDSSISYLSGGHFCPSTNPVQYNRSIMKFLGSF